MDFVGNFIGLEEVKERERHLFWVSREDSAPQALVTAPEVVVPTLSDYQVLEIKERRSCSPNSQVSCDLQLKLPCFL